MDHLGDNWWCGVSPEPEKLAIPGHGQFFQLSDPLHAVYSTGAPGAQFLSASQKNKARDEWLELSKAPAAPDYLAVQTVDWARSHRDDMRVPEGLRYWRSSDSIRLHPRRLIRADFIPRKIPAIAPELSGLRMGPEN